MNHNRRIKATFVVVGGGIAGVSCVEALKLYMTNEHSVLLISESPVIKVVTNIKFHTKIAAGFNIEDRNIGCEENVEYLIDKVIAVDSTSHIVYTENHEIEYKKLCLCLGATPKLLEYNKDYVIGLRDTHSVEHLKTILSRANRVIIVGNGGIATDLVYKLNGVEIIWVIRDEHISLPFLDVGAAQFFSNCLNNKHSTIQQIKRIRYQAGEESGIGAALGPDWQYEVMFGNRVGKNVIIEYKTEVQDITKCDQVKVQLTNGKIYECDFVVSATGVTPNSGLEIKDNKHFEIANDGGIRVNWKMETNLPDIFAAGDLCTVDWTSKHWFQMRLWSQARQMGLYAAKCMYFSLTNETILQDFCFELFSHVTSFFGFKVILLGLYNAQGLDKKGCELLVRVTDQEYIKLVIENGRVVGAMLIGDSDLEEMCENLILNQIDVTNLMDDLLDPNIDIDDYFD